MQFLEKTNELSEISIKEILFFGLLFTLLGLWYTYPLILHINQGIPFTRYSEDPVVNLIQGDHLEIYYNSWLLKDNLLSGRNPFANPYPFNYGQKIIFHPQITLLSFLMLLTSPLGEIVSYNLWVFLSFTLAGLSAFLLIRFYTQDRLASLVGGLIFSLAPYRYAQLGGHTTGFLFFLVPLVVFFLEKALQRGSGRYGFLAGLTVFFLAWSEYHLFYYLMLFLGVYLPLRVLHQIFNEYSIDSAKGWKKIEKIYRLIPHSKNLRPLLPFSLFILLSISYVMAIKIFIFEPSMAKAGRGVGEIALYSPGLKDIFIRFNENSEKFIYLGIIPLLLVGYLLYRLWSQRKEKPLGLQTGGYFLSLLYLTVLIISYLLTLGPNLRAVPLFLLFYKWLPFFNFPRVTARIIILSFLALSVLAGFSVFRLRDSLKKRGRWASTVVLFLAVGIVVDFYPAKTLGVSLLNQGNAVYETIQKNIGDQELVLELPLWPGDTSWSSIYEYYVTRYRYRMINGYSPVVPKTYVEQVFNPLYPLDFGQLGPSEYEVLKKFNVRYIVMHEEAFPEKVSPFPPCFTTRNLLNSPYLQGVQQSGSLFLFEVRPGIREKEPTPPISSVISTVFEAERLPRRTGKLILDSQASGYYSLFFDRKSPQAPLVRDPQALPGNAVFADQETDSIGLLNFGPYRAYPAGRYAAVFRLKTTDNSLGEAVARLEVSAQNGRILLAAREIKGQDFTTPGKYQDFPLHFTQEVPQKLEFRTSFLKKASLWLDNIVVSFADQGSPAAFFEAEDLWRKVGTTVADPEAANGQAVAARTTVDHPGYLVTGPYRKYPPGRYQVHFRLKAQAPQGFQEKTAGIRTVAVLDIAADFGRLLLARQELKIEELKPLGAYIEFPLEFQLAFPRELEFRVHYEEVLDLWVDRVSIVRQPSS